MHKAPPILGPGDFMGIENNIILVEHNDDDCSLDLLANAISERVNIAYQACDVRIGCAANYRTSAVVQADSIYQVYKCVKLSEPVDFFIINRIDMMDIDMRKLQRGAQMAAYISMLAARKILRGSNVIVTSAKQEHKLREIADRFIDLRK